MTRFVTTLALAGLVSSFALAASADSHMDAATMTCADYSAMSAEDQGMAMDAMETASMGAMADDTAMASDDTAMADDARMAAMMTACEGSPDMMAMDAMTSAMGSN